MVFFFLFRKFVTPFEVPLLLFDVAFFLNIDRALLHLHVGARHVRGGGPAGDPAMDLLVGAGVAVVDLGVPQRLAAGAVLGEVALHGPDVGHPGARPGIDRRVEVRGDGVDGPAFAVVCLVKWNPRDKEGYVFGYKDSAPLRR